MGLIYQLPISTEETDFVKQTNNQIELKSYGLPVIFWFYLIAASSVYSFMVLGAIDPLKKMLSFSQLDQMIAYFIIVFLISLPIICLGFFFYLKKINLNSEFIQIEHKVFGIKLRSFSCKFKKIRLEVDHQLDSPNMARMYPDGQLSRGFQNKGFFILKAIIDDSKTIIIDRSSSKSDLKKIATLLQNNGMLSDDGPS